MNNKRGQIMVNQFTTPKWVKGSIISAAFGYSSNAIAKKRQRGIWLEGNIWLKAPDNTIMYNPKAIEVWIENGNSN